MTTIDSRTIAADIMCGNARSITVGEIWAHIGQAYDTAEIDASIADEVAELIAKTGIDLIWPDGSTNTELDAARVEIDRVRAELTLVTDQRDAARAMADELRAELDRVRRERDEYAADNTRVAVSLVDVQRQLTAANHHTDGLTADVRDMQKANTAYANENARLRSKLADLEDVGRCDHDAGLDVECRPCLVETYGQREAEVAR